MIRTIRRTLRSWMPDLIAAHFDHPRAHQSVLRLRRPVTLNEKLQWLKLYYRNPLLHQLVDKYAVREYVRERIGDQYLNELLGCYESVNEIDLASLPSAFVLKGTHGSAMNILCRDKEALDWSNAREQMKQWLATDYAAHGREWAYHGVKRRVVCERYLQGPDGQPPMDYKIFCFNGEPKFVQVDIGRFTQHTRNLYDLAWHQLPCEYKRPNYNGEVPPPASLKTMISVSRRLADGLPFVRVDLYEVDQRIFFGEMTFYPENAHGHFNPVRFDADFGSFLELPRGV